MNFKQLLCKHNHVTISRWHETKVPAEIKDKVLYVDEIDVWNFVKCIKCNKILSATQKEKIFRSRDL